MRQNEEKRQVWQARVREYEASGQSQGAWCKARGISISTLRYWLKSLREEKTMARPWVQLTQAGGANQGLGMESESAMAKIVIGPFEVYLPESYNPASAQALMKALSSLC